MSYKITGRRCISFNKHIPQTLNIQRTHKHCHVCHHQMSETKDNDTYRNNVNNKFDCTYWLKSHYFIMTRFVIFISQFSFYKLCHRDAYIQNNEHFINILTTHILFVESYIFYHSQHKTIFAQNIELQLYLINKYKCMIFEHFTNIKCI